MSFKLTRSVGPLLTAVILCALFTMPTSAQLADLAFVETRAETTNYRETTRYDEAIAFLDVVSANSPHLHLASFGYSTEGRELPLLVFGRVADATPRAVRTPDVARVFIQATIHGGEVEGKEAMLMLSRAMAEGRYDHLLDSLIVMIAPIYNVDGNERISLYNRPRQHGPLGGMGTRANAQGYDLNRDHIKLDTPEARSLITLLDSYDPHVVVDLHATNGTVHGYHLTYSPPLHPSTAPRIVDLLRETWLPTLTERLRGQFDIDTYYYGNLPWRGMDAPRGWYTFDHRPRFNNNYTGLRNRFAILSEAYAYRPFEERVDVTRKFVDEILEFVLQNTSEIRSMTEEADAENIVGREVVLQASFAESDEPVEILMGEVRQEVHPFTGEVIYRSLDVRRPEKMPEFGTFSADVVTIAPKAYLLSGEHWRVIEMLHTHGIRTEVLEEDVEVDVERFRIDSTWVDDRPFEQHHQRSVDGAYERIRMDIPSGWVRVDVRQPLGRLAVIMLEPESDDGFLNWNILDNIIEDADTYPILRLPGSPSD